jgi:S1-C subfamily serine protease
MYKSINRQTLLTGLLAGLNRFRFQPGAFPDSQAAIRKAAVFGLLAALLMSVANCFAAQSLLSTESRKDLELQPGVVLILVQFKATLGPWTVTPSFLGSGFLYRPDGYLITNGHVAQMANENNSKADHDRVVIAAPMVTDAVLKSEAEKLKRPLMPAEKQAYIDQLNKLFDEGKMHIEGMSLTVLLSNGTSYQGEIKAYSDPITENGKDVAIIKIDGKNLPTVALGNSDDVNVGDAMTVVGYPGEATNAAMAGLFSQQSALIPTVTSGRISAVDKTDYRGTPVLQSETTINHGNSGGPAFDADGKVIGIATYTLNKSEGAVAGLNFFVPINTAMEFVRQAGADPERGPFDQMWHRALDAYAGQHWYQAHELMGSVLEMIPKEPDAMKLQLQAAENLRTEGPIAYWVDRVGLAPLLTFAGMLLLTLIALVVFVIRKPSAPPPAPRVAPSPAAGPIAVAPNPVAPPALLSPEFFGSLFIASGPLSGNRFQIPSKGLLIGRDPSLCTVILPDDTVSKEHAWVVPLDNGVVVIDRSSANGTYVNSVDSPRIGKMQLKNGDRIFIGRKNPTEITYFNS